MGGMSRASVGVGVGQTWQSSAYTSGTVRQNTSHKAIMVCVQALNGGSGAYPGIEVSPDNTTYFSIPGSNNSNSLGRAVGCAIVPAGWFYRSTLVGSAEIFAELK